MTVRTGDVFAGEHHRDRHERQATFVRRFNLYENRAATACDTPELGDPIQFAVGDRPVAAIRVAGTDAALGMTASKVLAGNPTTPAQVEVKVDSDVLEAVFADGAFEEFTYDVHRVTLTGERFPLWSATVAVDDNSFGGVR